MVRVGCFHFMVDAIATTLVQLKCYVAEKMSFILIIAYYGY